jgi:hypothetical protein
MKIFFFVLLLIPFLGCSKTPPINKTANKSRIEITCSKTEKGSYSPTSTIEFSCSIRNPLETTVNLQNLVLRIRNISKSGTFFRNVVLKENTAIEPGHSIAIDNIPIWTVPADAEKDAYGIYLSYTDQSNAQTTSYLTFFRVVDDATLTTFQINKTIWQGIDVFYLDGGMSEEYSVEKSVENMSNGISHSWNVNAPGSGPNPVYATPQFLQKSIDQTIKIYNDALGSTTPFENVIISTGIPSMPNISNTLQAPILPIHFLASSNTVKEIQSIMDYSNQNGLKCYATIGYDLSVPTAVAWIKLLDLPDAYLNFIKQHKVKNVIIIGSIGTSGGENKAKQVQNGCQGQFQSGSIYLLYPGNTPNDVTIMQQKIKDYNDVSLPTNYLNISDWESGIIQDQIVNISTTIKKQTTVNTYSLTTGTLINLYDLGTYATLSYFRKNKLSIKGVAINPYLLSHPVFEGWKGYIPLNYWQMNSSQNTIERLKTTIKNATLYYYPETNFEKLTMWVNSSNNFGAEAAARNLISTLYANGFNNIKQNDFSQDEVWNPDDGMNAPCEKIVSELKSDPSMFQWKNSLVPLTVDEFTNISKIFPGISFNRE